MLSLFCTSHHHTCRSHDWLVYIIHCREEREEEGEEEEANEVVEEEEQETWYPPPVDSDHERYHSTLYCMCFHNDMKLLKS